MNKQRKNLRIKQAERIAHLKRASISELEILANDAEDISKIVDFMMNE